MRAYYIGPGSFIEVQKLLPLLTAASPDHPSFHVVAFSLPGFGFSEAPRKPGFAGKQYAEVRPYKFSLPSECVKRILILTVHGLAGGTQADACAGI